MDEPPADDLPGESGASRDVAVKRKRKPRKREQEATHEKAPTKQKQKKQCRLGFAGCGGKALDIDATDANSGYAHKSVQAKWRFMPKF